MEHRCLEHHYTKLDTSLQISIYIDNSHIPMTDVPPSQLSRNALNTVTPDLAHLITDIYIYIDNAHIPNAIKHGSSPVN